MIASNVKITPTFKIENVRFQLKAAYMKLLVGKNVKMIFNPDKSKVHPSNGMRST